MRQRVADWRSEVSEKIGQMATVGTECKEEITKLGERVSKLEEACNKVKGMAAIICGACGLLWAFIQFAAPYVIHQ